MSAKYYIHYIKEFAIIVELLITKKVVSFRISQI